MTRQGHSHGWAWECIGPPGREPGPANQNTFFSPKGRYYRLKYSSVSSAVRVASLRRSRRWRSRRWRSWAGVVTRGLWGRLDLLPNSLCCDKTGHFRVAFYCPQHKVLLVGKMKIWPTSIHNYIVECKWQLYTTTLLTSQLIILCLNQSDFIDLLHVILNGPRQLQHFSG